MRRYAVLQQVRTFLVELPRRRDSGEGSERKRGYRGKGIYRK
jgi:hypothetical protein